MMSERAVGDCVPLNQVLFVVGRVCETNRSLGRHLKKEVPLPGRQQVAPLTIGQLELILQGVNVGGRLLQEDVDDSVGQYSLALGAGHELFEVLAGAEQGAIPLPGPAGAGLEEVGGVLITAHVGVRQHPRLITDDSLLDFGVLLCELFPGPGKGDIHADGTKDIFLQALDVKADNRGVLVVGNRFVGFAVEHAIHAVLGEHSQSVGNGVQGLVARDLGHLPQFPRGGRTRLSRSG